MKTRVRHYLLPVAALVLSCTAVQGALNYSDTVLSFNPVGYWRLSESVQPPAANIITNYGSLGAVANGFPFPYGIDDPNYVLALQQPGLIGTCITLTNAAGSIGGNWNSMIDVPYNDAFNPPKGSPFTVEFWAQPNTNSAGADLLTPVFSMDVNFSRSGYLVYYNVGGQRWNWRIGGVASYAVSIQSAANSALMGAWSHVVAVYDGAKASLYVNGFLRAGPSSVSGGAGYNPNRKQPFRIGGTTFSGWPGTGSGRTFDGGLQQVAYYTNVLSATTISNHWYLGTNHNIAGYAASVLASSPVGYWKLDEPEYDPIDPTTLPITANSGTLGAVARGTNRPGLAAGVAGPPFVGFPESPASNPGVKGFYAAGNVDLGNPAGLNFSTNISMIAWVKPTTDYGLRNILSHGYDGVNNLETQMRINNGIYEVGSWSPGEGASSAAGRAKADIGSWVFLAGTFDKTSSMWNLYRYDQLIASGSGGYGARPMVAPWSIGSRGMTNEPYTDGRYLGGWIDEVAIFTNALSQANIVSIFEAAQMKATIVTLITNTIPFNTPNNTIPFSPITNFSGDSVSFAVDAAGKATLLYQWTTNGTPIPGATGSTLALNNLSVSQTATNPGYAVIVTNDYGSSTSSIIPLTVISTKPLITTNTTPSAPTRYVGGTVSFSVAAIGNSPVTYQWFYVNGGAPVSLGAASTTFTSFTKTNLQTADAGGYFCQMVNPIGTTLSSTGTLTVISAPSTPYPAAVLADHPIAYYRLDEPANSTVASDYFGGHDGVYNANPDTGDPVTFGVSPGYSQLDPDKAIATTESDQYAGGIQGLDFSGGTTSFSIEAWVNAAVSQPLDGGGIVSKGRGPNGGGGVRSLQYSLDVTGGKYRFHVESSTATSDAIALVGPNGVWQHVVGVYDAEGATMSIYVDGVLSGPGAAAPAGGPLFTPIPTTIGAVQGGVTPTHDLYLQGSIDEVAIYDKALTEVQVLNHKCQQYGSSQAPLILVPPTSVAQYSGWPVSVYAGAVGSCTLQYQWRKFPGPTDIPGATDQILYIPAVSLSDVGDYLVHVSNSVNPPADSPTIHISVLSAPTADLPIPGLVLHMRFNNNLQDSSGRANHGTGTRNYGPYGTNIANVGPGPANGGLFEYVTGGSIGDSTGSGNPIASLFQAKGLHYSSDTGSAPKAGTGKTVGTNDYYVAYGVRPDFNFADNVDFTVAFWIRLPSPWPVSGNSYDGGDLPFFCNAKTSTGGNGFTFAPSYGSNGVFSSGSEVRSGTWAFSLNGTRTEGPNFYSLNDGLWHHMVHSVKRSGSAVTYQDGVQVLKLNVNQAGSIDSGRQACIGQDPTGYYPENGEADIADLGVWRGIAVPPVAALGLYVAATNGFSFSDTVVPPVITKGPGAGQVTITWSGGTLQSASAAAGPYTDVAGPPTSPYTVTASAKQYYRVRYF